MRALFRFLASMTGRWTRAIAGVILIVVGIWLVQGTWGWVIALIGLVPLLAGLFDRCVFAPLVGLPFNGPDLRQELGDNS
jgi:type IV secretory pathway VirB2 component (pilin)